MNLVGPTCIRLGATLLFGLILLSGDVSAAPPEGYKLVVAAEFDDPNEKFNPTDNQLFTTANFRLNNKGDWNFTRRLLDNKEQQVYLDESAEVGGVKLGINPFSISDGVLRITAAPLDEEHKKLLAPLTPEGKTPMLYSSGLLSTETDGRKGKGYVQLLGYWEMRAKLPKGKGLWPAFWLVTETHDYWDEVDILEVLGHKPSEVHHNTHFHDGGGTKDLPFSERISRTVDTSDGFHTYGMEITPTELLYSVDGVVVLRVSHTLEKPLYTIINLAVGGSWPGSPNKNTVFPATMEIDYLRIYQKE